jgi:hypothetical protein
VVTNTLKEDLCPPKEAMREATLNSEEVQMTIEE